MSRKNRRPPKAIKEFLDAEREALDLFPYKPNESKRRQVLRDQAQHRAYRRIVSADGNPTK